MAYTVQNFSVGQILTSAAMNQMMTNIETVRDHHIGAQAPDNPTAGIFWIDTSVNGAWVLKTRDDDGAWIPLFTINNFDNVAYASGDVSGERWGVIRQTNQDATGSEFAGPLLDFRNMVLNGSFQIWQRGNSFASAASGRRLADRWAYLKNGTATGVVSLSREASNLPPDQALYALRVDCDTAEGTVDSDDYHVLMTQIEGHWFRRALWGSTRALPLTLSFWVYATKPGVYSVSLRNSARARSYVAEYTVAEGAVWQRVVIGIDGDQAGTWERAEGEGCVISWALMSGASRKVTQSDQWSPGNYLAGPNQVNGLDSTSNDFMLAMVQLELGEVATPFCALPFVTELLLCQRYFWSTFTYGQAPAQNVGSFGALSTIGGAGNGRVSWNVRLPTPMRVAPTVTTYNTNAANANGRNLTDSGDRSVTVSRIVADSFAILSSANDSTDVGDELVIHASAEADFTPS